MLQHFELNVLLAMLRQKGETYSVPLVLELEKRGDKAVAQAAVFIALQRLEQKGLVASRMGSGDNGRARRYFKLTRTGLSEIKAHRDAHDRLWQGVDNAIKSHKA